MNYAAEHLLIVLSEEAAEVIHASSKALQFGILHPWPGKGESNLRVLERKLADLMAVADLLGLIVRPEDKAAKVEKLKKYMDLSSQIGTLESNKS